VSSEAIQLLRVRGVSKTFGGGRPVEALRGVDLEVRDSEFVSIVGPSGCGKSTLFNLIVGVETLSAGEIVLVGESRPARRRLLAAYLFQKDLLLPWRNVLDNAALGLEVARVCPRAEARKRAAAVLPRFGLAGFEGHHPAQLSGGMRQRVALLRTLLLQRPLLLLDEPFASLDALTRLDLQSWLQDTWRTGSRGALLVTHDVREALRLSNRVYVMSPRPGSIVAEVTVRAPGVAQLEAAQIAELERQVLQALRLPQEA